MNITIVIDWRLIALTSLIVLVAVGIVAPDLYRQMIRILRDIFQQFQ